MSAVEVEATFVGISPDYFGVLDIPLRAGRDFTWADDSAHPRAAIVSARLAEALFDTHDPVGQFIPRRPCAGHAAVFYKSDRRRVGRRAAGGPAHARSAVICVSPPMLQVHDRVTRRLPGAIDSPLVRAPSGRWEPKYPTRGASPRPGVRCMSRSHFASRSNTR